jgi:peptidylprolyl isomerase
MRRGAGEKSGYGKRVELKYRGRFFSGEEFNSTERLKNGVQDFYLGQEMQVIKGVEEALSFMSEGDKILLLIPSWLGFGVDGSSTGIVPPRTPIVYELELKKVN